jgi:6-phosphogluconolactonase
MELFISGYSDSFFVAQADVYGHTAKAQVASLPFPQHMSFFIYDTNYQRYYGVQEASEGPGALLGFRLDTSGCLIGEVELLAHTGAGPCHLAISPDHRWLATANYTSGTVDLFELDPSGDLLARRFRAVHCITRDKEGRDGRPPGFREDRQEAPHAHGVVFSQDSQVLFVCDLGIDQVLAYEVPSSISDRETSGPMDPKSDSQDSHQSTTQEHHGHLNTPKELQGQVVFQCHPGDGPRHLCFSADYGFAYLINELSCTVVVFRVGFVEESRVSKEGSTTNDWEDEDELGSIGSSGLSRATKFTQIQRISTLPPTMVSDEHVHGGIPPSITAAEIVLHPSGRFLYVSSRGYDTVVGFALDPVSGLVSEPRWYPSLGKIPRHIFFDPTGKVLFVANQDSNQVRSFDVDPVTGTLRESGLAIEVPKPTCGMVRV